MKRTYADRTRRKRHMRPWYVHCRCEWCVKRYHRPAPGRLS